MQRRALRLRAIFRAQEGRVALHGVVLAGGSGTRFWPRSTRSRPKQFIALGGGRTLIQATFDRLDGLVPAERRWVVAGRAYGELIREQIPGLAPSNVLLEPAPRDTAAAIGWAAATVAARAGRDEVLAVLPSDHRIAPTERFHAALREAESLARAGRIVTLGIVPTRPATGYGWIERGSPIPDSGPLPTFEVARFVEKPDLATAERLLAGNRHTWNGGIFVFAAGTLLDALGRHLPATRAALDKIVATPEVLDREWATLPKISIDYGVAEKERGLAVVEVDFAWSDVGSWEVAAELFHDEGGNKVDGAPFVGLEAGHCVVAGDGRLIAVLGLDDVVVVQQGDATLVCPRARAEDVKKLVAEIEKRGLGRYL
jgi:mannose-1-phosphate guanylyltransferase